MLLDREQGTICLTFNSNRGGQELLILTLKILTSCLRFVLHLASKRMKQDKYYWQNLTFFMLMFHFYTTWKIRKTRDFLVEMETWREWVNYINYLICCNSFLMKSSSFCRCWFDLLMNRWESLNCKTSCRRKNNDLFNTK